MLKCLGDGYKLCRIILACSLATNGMIALIPASYAAQSKIEGKTMTKPATKTATFTAPKKSAVSPDTAYTATIKTIHGDIIVALDAKAAPLGVTNFRQLAQGGFYNGLTFHRVEPGFVIQGGDPSGNGTGGPGYTIPAEIGLKHIKGAIAWARTGDQVNPERRSSGSQFYITLEPTPFLDGAYSVFGHVTSGEEVVAQVRPGDKILKIEVKP